MTAAYEFESAFIESNFSQIKKKMHYIPCQLLRHDNDGFIINRKFCVIKTFWMIKLESEI